MPELGILDDSIKQLVPLGQLGALILNPQALPHDLRVRVLDDLAPATSIAGVGLRYALTISVLLDRFSVVMRIPQVQL